MVKVQTLPRHSPAVPAHQTELRPLRHGPASAQAQREAPPPRAEAQAGHVVAARVTAHAHAQLEHGGRSWWIIVNPIHKTLQTAHELSISGGRYSGIENKVYPIGLQAYVTSL